MVAVSDSAMYAPMTATVSEMRAPLIARGQRGGQLGEAEGLPARGVERAQQLELLGVHGGERVDGRHERWGRSRSRR